jgi:glutamyl/glutaminyl-tRNA synthetase
LAVVVDDHLMEISHVIRGEDHISNTPKQILIYEALGQKPPLFAHHPLILAPDRTKLSARHGAMALIEYKKDYLPDAIANFSGGLGFTFSKDILSRDEMIQEFEL